MIVKTKQDLNLMVKALSQKEIIACDTEGTDFDISKFKFDGIGVGTSKKQFFIPYPNDFEEDIKKALKLLFDKSEVIFHNAKFDLAVFKKFKYPLPKKIHDTMILSWLYDETTPNGLKYLVRGILDRSAQEYTDLDRKVSLFRDADQVVEELADYCKADVKNTFDLFKFFKPKLIEQNIWKDYEKIEIPFIPLLMEMESRGVKLDVEWLKQKRDELKLLLDDLEAQIQIVVKEHLKEGYVLNIHSPQQLESFLFDTLGYETMKVTPGGKRSTDNEALEILIKKYKLKENDFIPMLLKFRDLDKIYRTYALGLLEQAKEGIVHASFLQHGTRTGRLASRNPNLQNIPAREDEWSIRQAFIARKGHKFIIADYSQIELRILAHFSQDENMLETFNQGGDIHEKTMELTRTTRREAKAVNFGLIYGMGPRTLAKNIGIKEDEAKTYIDRFFKGYPMVRHFIARIQQKTLNDGYVTMITGRRRRFYDYTDNRWFHTIRRQSFNTKIQGSAADLIKIAMLRLRKPLKKQGAYQLIQIHDEIIVEAPIENLEACQNIIKKEMEGAVKLRVPLKVGMIVGNHWLKG